MDEESPSIVVSEEVCQYRMPMFPNYNFKVTVQMFLDKILKRNLGW